jgi:hypothetical protein
MPAARAARGASGPGGTCGSSRDLHTTRTPPPLSCRHSRANGGYSADQLARGNGGSDPRTKAGARLDQGPRAPARHPPATTSQRRRDLAAAARAADLRHHDTMGERYRTPDGWTVEVVQLEAGERLCIRHHGFYIADVRSADDLARWIPAAELAQLERKTLMAVASPPRRPRCRSPRRAAAGTTPTCTHHVRYLRAA